MKKNVTFQNEKEEEEEEECMKNGLILLPWQHRTCWQDLPR